MKAFVLTAVAVAGMFACASDSKRCVNASDFGYDPMNATKCLQRALDSGARTVIVDATRGEWCIEPVFPRSNQEIVFGRNVVVRAVPGAYTNIYAMMFRSSFVTNITIRGEEGASISMLKGDYLDESRYRWSEWRHMFAFYDSAQITISNLTFSSSGGDGIYLARCKDIRIDNVNVLDHDRQGISVIGAENLYIGNSRFNCTGGTAPQCGIDFEPNKQSECFVNVVVEDCEFNGNDNCGVCFHLPHFSTKTRPIDIRIRRCRFIGNGSWGFRMYTTWSDPGVGGIVDVSDCLFAANRGGCCSIGGMASDSLKVSFRNCIFDNRGIDASAIVFDNGQSPFDFGGVSFADTKLYADDPDVFRFLGYTGVGITNVTGAVDVILPSGERRRLSMSEQMAKHRPDPETRKFTAAAVSCRNLVPTAPAARLEPDAVMCRGRQYFLQAAQTPGERKLVFRCRRVSDNPYRPEVTVSDKVGTPVGKFTLKDDVTEYILKTTVPDNIHMFTINSRGNLCGVESASPGHGVRADSRVHIADASGRRMYFTVPPASKIVKAEIFVRNGTGLTARILDSTGAVRAEVVKADSSHILTIRRDPTEKSERWCISIEEMKWPFGLRLGGDVVSVLSDSPDGGLEYGKKK